MYVFQALLIFGVWPYVVRSISMSLCGECPVGFYVEVERNIVRCSVTVAECDSLRGCVLFEVVAMEDWERRVSERIADYWCCLVEELVPICVSCVRLPSLRRLVEGEGGRRCLEVNPVQLESVLHVVTTTGLSVFPGQDVHMVMNFLLTKLRACLTNPVLSSCPALLRVSMIF